MAVLAIAVGLIAGYGAVAFRGLISLFHNLFFAGRLSLDYDALQHTAPSRWGAFVVLVPVVGALGVVYLVRHFAPEAKGHGVPEVIDAIHFKGGRIRPQVAAVKALASSISIGSGGSIGREGPIIQIGATFGSMLAGWLQLDRVAATHSHRRGRWRRDRGDLQHPDRRRALRVGDPPRRDQRAHPHPGHDRDGDGKRHRA